MEQIIKRGGQLGLMKSSSGCRTVAVVRAGKRDAETVPRDFQRIPRRRSSPRMSMDRVM